METAMMPHISMLSKSFSNTRKHTGHLPSTFKTSHGEPIEKESAIAAAANLNFQKHQQLIEQHANFIEGDVIGIL